MIPRASEVVNATLGLGIENASLKVRQAPLSLISARVRCAGDERERDKRKSAYKTLSLSLSSPLLIVVIVVVVVVVVVIEKK